MARGDDKKARQMNQQMFSAGQAETAAARAKIDENVNSYKGRIDEIFKNNPYLDPSYLNNLNDKAAMVSHGVQKNVQSKMTDFAERSGTNSANVTAAGEEGQREASRQMHDIVTGQAVADKDKYEEMKMHGISMLGAIPGMYNPLYAGGINLQGGGSSGMTTMAGQGSWYDNLINAGIGAAGAVGAAYCPLEGSLIQTALGQGKPVETLKAGDQIMSRSGVTPNSLLADPESASVACVAVIAKNGCVTKCSETHAIMLEHGFVRAKEALGFDVDTAEGISRVNAVVPLGFLKVWQLKLDGDHTYLADGMWGLE